MIKRIATYLLSAVLGASSLLAQADITIDITGVGGNQLPIAIANFVGEAGLKDALTPIVRNDLDHSGRFKLVDPSGATLPADGPPPDLGSWKGRGADSLAIGDVRIGADNNYDVRLRLYDTVTLKLITGVQIHTATSDMRQAAHQVADVIYEALTGERGIFETKIAFVVKKGSKYELQVADADGFNAQEVFGSREPIMSPTWAPDGHRIAYVSFEQQKPIVVVQDVYTGSRNIVANFKGSNSGPTFAPNGHTMAVTLSIDGISQIYVLDGGSKRRLMQTPAIDTEANFSPDGGQIAFTSDRGGSPQIYLVPATGGNAQRLTFEGSYNVTPRFSPDGKMLAYIRRDGGSFNVATFDMTTRQTMVLTEGPGDESPTFAPNGKMILYATQVGGRGVLATVSSDGRVHQRLSTQGDVREPAWGPFPNQLPMSRLSSNP
ncbi:MAG: Tol-Pal system protein TolB [Burkholderiales bacterium]|nr:Tol-Pal system protein TolB [Burkholderiales bacterium]